MELGKRTKEKREVKGPTGAWEIIGDSREQTWGKKKGGNVEGMEVIGGEEAELVIVGYAKDKEVRLCEAYCVFDVVPSWLKWKLFKNGTYYTLYYWLLFPIPLRLKAIIFC